MLGGLRYVVNPREQPQQHRKDVVTPPCFSCHLSCDTKGSAGNAATAAVKPLALLARPSSLFLQISPTAPLQHADNPGCRILSHVTSLDRAGDQNSLLLEELFAKPPPYIPPSSSSGHVDSSNLHSLVNPRLPTRNAGRRRKLRLFKNSQVVTTTVTSCSSPGHGRQRHDQRSYDERCQQKSLVSTAAEPAPPKTLIHADKARAALLAVLNPLILQEQFSLKQEQRVYHTLPACVHYDSEGAELPLSSSSPPTVSTYCQHSVAHTAGTTSLFRAAPLPDLNSVYLPPPKSVANVEDCPSVASTATSVGGQDSTDAGSTSGSETRCSDETERLHPVLAQLFDQAAANNKPIAKFANPYFMRSPEPADLPLPFGLRARDHHKLSHSSVTVSSRSGTNS